MFSISGKKEKKNSKLKIEIKFFRSGLFLTVGRERGNKSNFIFGLTLRLMMPISLFSNLRYPANRELRASFDVC